MDMHGQQQQEGEETTHPPSEQAVHEEQVEKEHQQQEEKHTPPSASNTHDKHHHSAEHAASSSANTSTTEGEHSHHKEEHEDKEQEHKHTTHHEHASTANDTTTPSVTATTAETAVPSTSSKEEAWKSQPRALHQREELTSSQAAAMEDKSIQCNGLATPPPSAHNHPHPPSSSASSPLATFSSSSSSSPLASSSSSVSSSVSSVSGASVHHTKNAKDDRSVLNITFMTSGSRGDVQPYLCLSLALQNAGHKILFATEERMKGFVQSFGITYAHVSGDPTSVLFSKEGQQMLKDGKIFKMMSEMKKLSEPTYEQCLADYTKACENADVIISGPLCMTQAYCIAEKNNIPWTCLALGPSVETGDFPLFMVSQTNLFFRFANKATYSLLFWSLWKSEEKNINKWRTTTLGLKPMKGGIADVLQKTNATMIHCYPDFIIPGGKRPSDWAECHQLVGFVFPPDGHLPRTPSLEAFVADTSGGLPIYLGFGSMPAPNPKQLLLLAAKVVNNLNIRAVIVAGWSEVSEEMEREIFGEDNRKVIIVPSAPHEWLLPRCSLAVHHCGIGTTAAVLRAGIPSVPCPVYLDQPYWGHRLNELGVAAKPISFQKLTAELLTNGIKEVLSSPTMSNKAKEMKTLINEDGVEKAVELVLQIAEGTPQFVQW